MNPHVRVLDLRLYLVTDTALCGRRGVPATVAAAVSGGVTMVQLRDHDLGDDEFVALGRVVRAALAGTGVPLLVNDRAHLVQPIGADGVHVGQRDLPPARARELLGPQAVVGLSVSTVDEVRAARETGEDVVDYLGVGPVWATPTKPDHDPPIGPGGLADVTAASPWPVVAIGGITAELAPALAGTRAAGVAIVSAICAAADPAAAAAELRAGWATENAGGGVPGTARRAVRTAEGRAVGSGQP